MQPQPSLDNQVARMFTPTSQSRCPAGAPDQVFVQTACAAFTASPCDLRGRLACPLQRAGSTSITIVFWWCVNMAPSVKRCFKLSRFPPARLHTFTCTCSGQHITQLVEHPSLGGWP